MDTAQTSSTFLALNTTELRQGDIVVTHGMRVLLETEPLVFPNGRGSETYQFGGRVVNLDEVRAAGAVPMSFLRTHKWTPGTGWTVDREDVWPIQGNELAHWSVDRPASTTA